MERWNPAVVLINFTGYATYTPNTVGFHATNEG